MFKNASYVGTNYALQNQCKAIADSLQVFSEFLKNLENMSEEEIDNKLGFESDGDCEYKRMLLLKKHLYPVRDALKVVTSHNPIDPSVFREGNVGRPRNISTEYAALYEAVTKVFDADENDVRQALQYLPYMRYDVPGALTVNLLLLEIQKSTSSHLSVPRA